MSIFIFIIFIQLYQCTRTLSDILENGSHSKILKQGCNHILNQSESLINRIQFCNDKLTVDKAIANTADVQCDDRIIEKSLIKNSIAFSEKANCEKDLIFWNPEQLWGKFFNNARTKILCEACIYSEGSSIDCIRYTKRGLDMCVKVCERQNHKILKIPPTILLLKDAYCTKKLLKAATCICVFKVICTAYKYYVFIHFIVNRNGDIASRYYESGHPLQDPL